MMRKEEATIFKICYIPDSLLLHKFRWELKWHSFVLFIYFSAYFFLWIFMLSLVDCLLESLLIFLLFYSAHLFSFLSFLHIALNVEVSSFHSSLLCLFPNALPSPFCMYLKAVPLQHCFSLWHATYCLVTGSGLIIDFFFFEEPLSNKLLQKRKKNKGKTANRLPFEPRTSYSKSGVSAISNIFFFSHLHSSAQQKQNS